MLGLYLIGFDGCRLSGTALLHPLVLHAPSLPRQQSRVPDQLLLRKSFALASLSSSKKNTVQSSSIANTQRATRLYLVSPVIRDKSDPRREATTSAVD